MALIMLCFGIQSRICAILCLFFFTVEVEGRGFRLLVWWVYCQITNSWRKWQGLPARMPKTFSALFGLLIPQPPQISRSLLSFPLHSSKNLYFSLTPLSLPSDHWCLCCICCLHCHHPGISQPCFNLSKICPFNFCLMIFTCKINELCWSDYQSLVIVAIANVRVRLVWTNPFIWVLVRWSEKLSICSFLSSFNA